MEIKKIESDLLKTIQSSIRNYLYALLKNPNESYIENLNVKRIRYVKDWLDDSTEDAFIIEVSAKNEIWLLSRSELGLTIEEYKKLIHEQNQSGLSLGKDFLTHQVWYEFPIVWGSLDDIFDDIPDYEDGGKYAGNNYTTFKMKYD